jgi:hypothetical protein
MSLDAALLHFKRFDECRIKQTGYYTAPLIKLVQHEMCKNASDVDLPIETSHMSLAEDWPWWSVSEYEIVKPEIQADPRWNEWVSKLQ